MAGQPLATTNLFEKIQTGPARLGSVLILFYGPPRTIGPWLNWQLAAPNLIRKIESGLAVQTHFHLVIKPPWRTNGPQLASLTVGKHQKKLGSVPAVRARFILFKY